MARRRVQGNIPLLDSPTFNQADILRNIGGLADLANLVKSDQGLDGGYNLRGAAQDMEEVEPNFPRLPIFPPEQDQVGVDDVPGIPAGIELLGDLAQSESAEDALDEVSETDPRGGMGSSMMGAILPTSPIIQAVGDYFSPSKREEMEENNKEVLYGPEEVQVQQEQPISLDEEAEEVSFSDLPMAVRSVFNFPTKEPEEVQVQQEQPISLDEEAEEVSFSDLPMAVRSVFNFPTKEPEDIQAQDLPDEGLAPVPGAVESAQDNQDVQDVLFRLLDVKKGIIPDEVWSHAKKIQDILGGQKQDLDQQEQRILERLDSGEATSMDKVALAMAVAIPVIMGMVYGKEGFFGALSGLGASLQKTAEGQIKEVSGLKDQLGKIQKERGEIELKEADLVKDLTKQIQSPELRKLVTNYDMFDIVQNESGEEEVVPGKNIEMFDGKVGVKAPGEEGEALFYDADKLRDDESVKEFRSSLKEGAKEYQSAKNSNRLIGQVMDIMNIIRKQDPTILSNLGQYIQPSKDGLLTLVFPKDKMTTMLEIAGPDGEIKKVRAYPILNGLITALQDPYNKEYLGGTRLTEGVQKHWRDVFANPASIKSWLTSDYETMVEQGKSFQNILNNRVSDKLVGMGFLREPLKEALEIQEPVYRVGQGIDERKSQEVKKNPEKFKKYLK